MINYMLTCVSNSISKFKKIPMMAVQQANWSPLAVLNHNRFFFYCVTPAVFEAIIERIEDQDLMALACERANQAEVEVKLDDL